MSPTRQVMPVIRRPEQLSSDDKRVITRYLDFGNPKRIRSILRRLMSLPETDLSGLLDQIRSSFKPRHRDLDAAFLRNFAEVAPQIRKKSELSENRKLVLGAYFTLEYSIESAALFNPSIVLHPDQSGLGPDQLRFLMSLRATGEGHVSSIVFRRGILHGDGRGEDHVIFDPPPRYAYTAKPTPDRGLSKIAFCRKLQEMGDCEDLVARVLIRLPDRFSPAQLIQAVNQVRKEPDTPSTFHAVADEMVWIAQANYELEFPEDVKPSETVIFPATAYERNGMEDLRLVRFLDEDGQVCYYGTYTAYDGRNLYVMLLETEDFHHFHVSTLSGKFARNKGMALFPRKVNGQYMMVGRHDGENLYLLRSNNLYVWNHSQKLQMPTEPWELVQIGNCGSPLETQAGWLLLTHGVGPVREYAIAATLLDRDDPSKILGRLKRPLLVPNEEEREGYVPNVVYSCGAIIHGDNLVIPYAMSDSRTAFAIVDVDDLVKQLLASGI
ncbi:MAG: glycoside hydrolase family 130 protein [Phycisphaerae bacterium]